MPEIRNGRIPVSVVVLTHREERNLPACLESVREWAGEVHVVDSYSDDATVTLAREAGAQVALHPFQSHAEQWAWALSNLPLRYDWVLGLDADQRVTSSLARSIADALAEPDSRPVAGYFVARRQVFRGRWIRHGGYYPKYLLKLFRRDAVHLDQGDLVDHHFRVAGETARLDGDLIEDNAKESDISFWIAKHNAYAERLAREEMGGRRNGAVPARLLGNPDERVAWQKNLWSRLPLYFRPGMYFFYRYVLRLGFLDGKEGFVFHFLHAFWYRLLIDVHLDEMREDGRVRFSLPGRHRTGPLSHPILTLVGITRPRAFHTPAENRALGRWGRGRRTVVEIGVAEGGSAVVLRRAMDPQGTLYLIDPFRLKTLGLFKVMKRVARRNVGGIENGAVKWIEEYSHEAAGSWDRPIDFLFIDGDHSYDGVRRDWEDWSPFVPSGGVVALHDARTFERGWTTEGDGPVRLVRELREGPLAGTWKVADEVDSLVVLERS